MSRIKAGIIGGAGYTGGELLRVLLLHPNVDLAFVQSNSSADKPIHAVHNDLVGETDLVFSSAFQNDADVLFLCGGHDAAKKFLTENELSQQLVVIDLSQDFRHNSTNNFAGRNFVYGLPELNREQIRTAKSIANPGCFATCIELALLPLAAAEKLSEDVHINATTGSTGAGQSLSETSHFSWRSNNLSVYKPFEHQHLKEITESLQQLQNGLNSQLNFIPQRGSFTRGIFASCYTKCSLSQEELVQLYFDYYFSHPFVRISNNPVDVKMVVNTNRCFLNVKKQGEYVFVTSVIDNLLKGASGQAVQNMNLIFGLDEKAGLQLKSSAF